MDTLTHGLLTYLVHSTLLLGAVALVRRLLGDRRLALQEALLRAALVGGVLTAGAQTAFDLRPLGGALRLPAPHADAANPPLAAVATVAVMPSALDRSPLGVDIGVTVAADSATAPLSTPTPSGRRAVDWTVTLQRAWRPALAALWTVLALVGLTRLALAAIRLRHLLRGRRPLRAAEIPHGAETVARVLGLGTRVRLSAAPLLAVPIATGVRRPEVCLPTRVLDDLVEEEQAALCAHELAHLARRDPAWLLIAHVVAAFAAIQPLNHWARRRLADLAECLSDDLAIAASARPLGLARSLVDVASWTVSQPSVIPATAAGAFGARSRLAYRVERLMNPKRALELPGRLWLPLATLAILATAVVSKVVSGSTAPQAFPAIEVNAAPQPAQAPAPPAPALAAAAPAPPAPPASPAKPDAPEAPEPPDEERVQEITLHVEKRAHTAGDETVALEVEVERLAAGLEPKGEELARLVEEITEASTELATALAPLHAEGAKRIPHSKDQAAARARIAELAKRLRTLSQRMRPSEGQLRTLRHEARTLAHNARPTEAEQAELRRLAKEAARAHRDIVVRVHASSDVRVARDHARRAQERAREAQEEARRAQHELRRALEEEARARTEAPSRAKPHPQTAPEL